VRAGAAVARQWAFARGCFAVRRTIAGSGIRASLPGSGSGEGGCRKSVAHVGACIRGHLEGRTINFFRLLKALLTVLPVLIGYWKGTGVGVATGVVIAYPREVVDKALKDVDRTRPRPSPVPRFSATLVSCHAFDFLPGRPQTPALGDQRPWLGSTKPNFRIRSGRSSSRATMTICRPLPCTTWQCWRAKPRSGRAPRTR
jgi:hypothetical protein